MEESDFVDLIQESLEEQHEASTRKETSVELALEPPQDTQPGQIEEPDAETTPSASIRANVRESIGYSLVRIRVPLIRRLELTVGTQPIEEAVLHAHLYSDQADEPVAAGKLDLGAIAAGETVEPGDIELHYDARHFVQLDESSPGRVELKLESNRGTVTASTPVRLLAYNQWDGLSSSLGAPLFETLAVHVLPNHPRVEEVRRAASERLKKTTGSSSQEGYQAGPERALAIAKSTFETIQSLNVHYSNPPASSEAFQKVRTPDQVLDEKFGTCLDTTCLYAACLEQAGLNPVLFVIEGHAFAGLLLKEGLNLSAATPSIKIVDLLLDQGLLVLIETTMLCVQEGELATFEAAQAEALGRLRTNPFACMVNVAAARRENLRPLPSRVRNDDGVVEIHHDEGGGGRTVVVGQRRFEGTDRPTESAPGRFVGWQSELLDLSLRNPLLNLRLGGRGGGVRMAAPKDGLKNLELRLAAGSEVSLFAHDQLTDIQRAAGARTARQMGDGMLQSAADQGAYFIEVEEQRLKSRIRGLRTKARAMEDETGANILHLCLGSVVWTDPDKRKEVRSPLLLLPVRLENGGRSRPPQLLADLSGDGTTVNHCLLEKLRQTFQLEIPEVAAWRGDIEDADITRVFSAMRAAVLEAGLTMDVEEDASLALLHFGKFRMWRDLCDHWPTFLEQPLVRHLVETPGREFVDPIEPLASGDLDVAEAYCPVAHDGSQLEAILAASHGNSFVLEGPPGTGKSQTITNLIANALAHGRRILFVAEKRAALDVVKSRLAKVGLAPYCLDIHDKKSTPLQLREQLKASLDAQFETDLPAFEKVRHELGEVAGRLRSYTSKLHEPNGIGLSAWSARQQLLELGEGEAFDLPEQVLQLSSDGWDRLERDMRELPRQAEDAGLRACHPWAMIDDGDDDAINFSSLANAIAHISQLQEALAALPPTAREKLESLQDVEQLELAEGLIRARLEGCTLDLEALTAAHALGKTDHVPQLDEQIGKLAAARTSLLEVFSADALALDLQATRTDIEKARQSFFLFRKGRIRKAESSVRTSLKQPGLDSDALLAALKKAIDHQSEARRATDTVKELPGVTLPDSFDLSTDTGIDIAKATVKAVASTRQGASTQQDTAIPDLLALPVADLAALLDPVRQHAAAWSSLLAVLPCGTLTRWLSGRTLTQAAASALPDWRRDAEGERFLELGRWCRLVRKLHGLRVAGIDALADGVLLGDINAGDALRVLRRSAAKSSLSERLRTAGLARFDGREHTADVDRFSRLHGVDSDALADVLPYKLLETRPFKPGQRRGQVGELYRHELTRKKGGSSIRKLIDDYTDAIKVLTPCVLASPASVAQYLAPGVIDFDLVIFDEASQVPVSDAIGAMGRGKAVVIVGDSKQMPPTSFFSSSGASSDDDPPDSELAVDMESILSEAVASGLNRIWLSWHYRSQDEQLIAFSNRFYYESRLASFPAPGRTGCTMGVSWQKVDGGTFLAGDQRTNQKEAAAIVAEIQRRARDPVDRDRSIGVVALNLNQAELIRELLEEAATSDGALSELLEDESEEGLFVKNLESVQGDERDVILISVTYAKNQAGRLPMNFGPLNRIGGERRWNVLVTRAKQEVVVFSSIEPEDIKLERVSSMAKGVHHMREYMLLARDGIEGEGGRRIQKPAGRDEHRHEVAEHLRQAGFVVEEDLGLSSFKIDLSLALPEDPERKLLAVLLDGPDYARRRTVQDRDGLPSTVLSKLMKWPGIQRVWLPQWLAEPDRVTEQLQKAARDARDQQDESRRLAEAARELDAKHEAQDAAEDERDEDEIDFLAGILETVQDKEENALKSTGADGTGPAHATTEPAEPVERDPEDLDFAAYTNEQPLGNKDDLSPEASGAARRQIQAGIHDVLQVEAPVEANRLGRLVARRFGLKRVRQDRIDFILQHLEAGALHESTHGRFVWSQNIRPDSWKCFRRATPAGEDRKVEEIAPEEIRNALVYIAEKGLGVRDQGALADLAEFFGFKRLTKGIKEHLESVITWSIESGHLRREDGRIYKA